ncbi:hypothetical protein ACTFIR_000861 [Dictyostelium discoideum]
MLFEERESKELDNPYCDQLEGKISSNSKDQMIEQKKHEELSSMPISKLNPTFLQQIQVPLRLKVGDPNKSIPHKLCKTNDIKILTDKVVKKMYDSNINKVYN